MRASSLKKLLATVSDDALIVLPSADHTYRKAQAQRTTALVDPMVISEDLGEDITPEAEYGQRVEVLVIS